MSQVVQDIGFDQDHDALDWSALEGQGQVGVRQVMDRDHLDYSPLSSSSSPPTSTGLALALVGLAGMASLSARI